ncbi:Uncharacterised protein [Acinetobacter baumannii]|nr:Uncharacterised protein [Acinetobacter baumannii]
MLHPCYTFHLMIAQLYLRTKQLREIRIRMPPRQQCRLAVLGVGRFFNVVLDMQHRTTGCRLSSR